MRRIDADYIREKIWEAYQDNRICTALDIIDNAPTVEQPTGEWIFDSDNIMFGNPYGSYKCTNCNSWTGWVTHFCSNCGAKMEGGEEE